MKHPDVKPEKCFVSNLAVQSLQFDQKLCANFLKNIPKIWGFQKYKLFVNLILKRNKK